METLVEHRAISPIFIAGNAIFFVRNYAVLALKLQHSADSSFLITFLR